jgi:hypothetical protein
MISYAPRHADQNIPERSVGRAMLALETAPPRPETPRAPATVAQSPPDPRRRLLLRAQERLPVADAAEGLPAVEDYVPLLQEVAHRRDFGGDEPGAAAAVEAGARTRPRAKRRDSGLPVGKDDRGWRRAEGLRRRQEGEGRKRHVLVDTEGLLVEARVHSAKVPDQNGIKRLLEPARGRLPRLSYLWVNAG